MYLNASTKTKFIYIYTHKYILLKTKCIHKIIHIQSFSHTCKHTHTHIPSVRARVGVGVGRRQTNADRETDRQTDRQTDRESEREE
jgi:hypothetical protein